MGEEKSVVTQESEGSPVPPIVEQVGQIVAEPKAQDAAQSDAQHPMESLLSTDYSFQRLRRGQIVEGVIVQIHPTAILVDVGSKSEGIITGREIERLGPEGFAELQEGGTLLVYILNPEGRTGNPILSLSRAQAERDWREAQQLFEAGKLFEGTVTGFNKGGLIVRMGKVRGFVPSSQIVSLRRRAPGPDGEEPFAGLVGKELQLKIIEIDRNRNRLILSERAAMREWRRQHKERLLAELQEGDTRTGEVISLCDFGAFVDLGGADGLIHLSELSWRRISHPGEILKVGDQVQVYILNVDRDRRRIGLSMKRLETDPWDAIAQRYRVGQLVEGTITKLVKFGAFARIFDDDIEGLIHLSELSDERIAHPREAVQEEDVRTLRIIRIDSEQRRIGLSLKRVTSEEYVDVDWQDGYDQAQVHEENATEEDAVDEERAIDDASCSAPALDDESGEQAIDDASRSAPALDDESGEQAIDDASRSAPALDDKSGEQE